MRLSSSWRQILTEDLTIIGDASEYELREIVTELGAFRLAMTKLFPDIRLRAPVPTTIVVFKSNDAFNRYRPRDSRGKVQFNVGGYLTTQPEANFIVFGSGGQDANHRYMFHEYAHFLIHLNARTPVPTWLDEGLAEFYSSFVSDYKGQGLLGKSVPDRWLALRRLAPMPLRQVVSPREQEQMWQSSDRVQMFYAESWALVHYLMIGRNNPSPNALGAYLSALARSASQDAAFREAFGVDIDAMDRELRAYGTRLILPALTVPRPVGATAPRAALMREVDVLTVKGTLLTGTTATVEAEPMLRTALALDPTHAAARVALARLAIDSDRPADAIAALRPVVAEAPSNLAALYYLGLAQQQGWRHEEALATFDRAVRLNPEHARSWAGLSDAALALKRDPQANAALQQALHLESDLDIYIRHAQSALRLGRNDIAATAARAYVDRKGLGEEAAQYAAFLAAIAGWRDGQPADADAILLDAQRAIPQNGWTWSVLKFLQGASQPEQLLAAAKNALQRTEAHAYIGFKLDSGQRADEALVHFQWVAREGARNATEYTLVQNELARRRHAAE